MVRTPKKRAAICRFYHENYLWKGINTKSETKQHNLRHWCELKQIVLFAHRLDKCNPGVCNYFDPKTDIDKNQNVKRSPRFTKEEINEIKKFEQDKHQREILDIFKKCEPTDFPDDEDAMKKLGWVAENYIDFIISTIASDERIRDLFMQEYHGPSCLMVHKIVCRSISEVKSIECEKSSGGSQKSVTFKIIIELIQASYPMWGSTDEIIITCNARNLDIVHQRASIDTSVSLKYIDGWLAN